MNCLAILVNYRAARLIVEAVASLWDDPECSEIHVVDNSELASEVNYLEAHLPAGVRLTVCERNLGFARACNLAYAASDAEAVLLLNPDARLLPGALACLKQTLCASPKVGAVGPRVFWDDAGHFILPPSTYPSRWAYFLGQIGSSLPWLARRQALAFRRRALREWRAEVPFSVDALSGGHALLRRRAVDMAGGLFDPAFFMYWEDSDLMRRLQDAGWRLLLEPRASAVHLYEHSSSKDRLISDGWPVFEVKHFSTWPWRGLRRGVRLVGQRQPLWAFEVLAWPAVGDLYLSVPFELHAGWLLEFSPAPSFVPAMGCFGLGARATLPRSLAARFQGQDCYLRLGSVDEGDVFLQPWRVQSLPASEMSDQPA